MALGAFSRLGGRTQTTFCVLLDAFVRGMPHFYRRQDTRLLNRRSAAESDRRISKVRHFMQLATFCQIKFPLTVVSSLPSWDSQISTQSFSFLGTLTAYRWFLHIHLFEHYRFTGPLGRCTASFLLRSYHRLNSIRDIKQIFRYLLECDLHFSFYRYRPCR